MTEVIGVRFREEGKIYYFDPRGITVECGTDVIVETSRGIEYGVCVSPNETIEDALIVQPLRPMLRIANEDDKRQWQENRKKEAEAFTICETKILEHGLVMKLVEVEYTLDGSKILFFFTSEGRVDFRELVKELASIFRTRIELRQIGVRDEAKMLGGLGICGRPFCCATFMDEFQPVSIKMAKTQNLSLNPTKISGTCGRLMCCLKYEQDAYEYLLANSIKTDSYVKTVDGKGTVVDVNLFKGTIKVRLEGENDASTLKTYKSNQVFVLRNGKKGQVQEEPAFLPQPEPEPEPHLPDFSLELQEKAPEEDSKQQPDQPAKKQHNNRRRKKSPQSGQGKPSLPDKQVKQPDRMPPNKIKKPEGQPVRQQGEKIERDADKPYQKKTEPKKPEQKKPEQEQKKQPGRPGGYGSRQGKSRRGPKGAPPKPNTTGQDGRQQPGAGN